MFSLLPHFYRQNIVLPSPSQLPLLCHQRYVFFLRLGLCEASRTLWPVEYLSSCIRQLFVLEFTGKFENGIFGKLRRDLLFLCKILPMSHKSWVSGRDLFSGYNWECNQITMSNVDTIIFKDLSIHRITTLSQKNSLREPVVDQLVSSSMALCHLTSSSNSPSARHGALFVLLGGSIHCFDFILSSRSFNVVT